VVSPKINQTTLPRDLEINDGPEPLQTQSNPLPTLILWEGGGNQSTVGDEEKIHVGFLP